MRSLFRISLFVLAAFVSDISANERQWAPTRLPDGHVDLQGVWAHTNLTPFERPDHLKSLAITDAEAADIKHKVDAKNDDLSRPAEPSLYFDDRRVEPIRGELRSSIVTDPANGKIPGNAAFKEQSRQAGKDVLSSFDGPEQRPASERCLGAPSAQAPIQLIPASDLRQIVQTPSTVVMTTEELHEARVIRMNAAHVPSQVSSWLGDSIGHWDGDTLVVETTNFAPTSAVRSSPNSMVLLSPHAVVTERLTRTSTAEMRYEFNVNDPAYYTQLWSGETRLHLSSARMLEYACHEGNYSLYHVLSAARALEAESDLPN